MFFIYFVVMMNDDYIVEVGIATYGTPLLHAPTMYEGHICRCLENQRIGLGFHWERDIVSILPGDVSILDTPVSNCGGRYTLINRLPLELYLECVVGSEMNPAAPVEFLRAHAIISRSWVMGKLRRFRTDGEVVCGDNKHTTDTTECAIIGWEDVDNHAYFDVCADDHCQRYQGMQSISSVARDAIRSTAGIVLCSPDGELVDARFSKCCGGHTELFSSCWQDIEKPCLEAFVDPWCNLSDYDTKHRRRIFDIILKDYDKGIDGGFRWSCDVSKVDVRRNLVEKFGCDIGQVVSMECVERGSSGRLKYLRIIGEDDTVLLGKELYIRRLFSDSHLFSSAFEYEDLGDSFKLYGKGWGHGVGLCQIGAANMSLSGMSCEDILSFYYPDSRLVHF